MSVLGKISQRVVTTTLDVAGLLLLALGLGVILGLGAALMAGGVGALLLAWRYGA